MIRYPHHGRDRAKSKSNQLRNDTVVRYDVSSMVLANSEPDEFVDSDPGGTAFMSSDLIEQIYDAALDIKLLPNVLAGVAAACGAVSTTLVSGQNLAGLVISSGVEESQAAYAAHWWQYDVIAQAIFSATRNGLFCDWKMLNSETRTRHPFYQEFRRSFGLRDNVTITAEPELGSWFGLSLQLPSNADGPPSPGILHMFEGFGRHLSRSLLFTRRIHAPDATGGMAEVMNALSCGIACIDAEGRVILVNPALQAFAKDGITMTGGRLRAANPADQPALDMLIWRALHAGSQPGPSLASLRRPSFRRNLLVGALPFSDYRSWLTFANGMPGCRAVVTVVDPEADVPKGLESALRALSLSPAEARLAAVVGRGMSPREAAKALDLTEGTARTRLKQIFDKLELTRQSELARLVTQLSMFRA